MFATIYPANTVKSTISSSQNVNFDYRKEDTKNARLAFMQSGFFIWEGTTLIAELIGSFLSENI